MHDPEVSISNTNNNQTDRQAAALNYLIDHLLFIVNLAVSQNEQN